MTARTETAPGPVRLRPLDAFALLLIVGLAYWNALHATFQFDDFQMIVNNAHVHGIAAWWNSLPGIRPLLKFSYAINWAISPAPGGWHAFNLLLHGLNTLLLWRLASDWQRDLRLPVATARYLPGAVAALFALHPATTEAVTYVSGRSLSLMTTFYLAALIAHRRAEDATSGARWRLGAAAAFALALAVRETAATLPIACVLYAFFRGQTLRQASRDLKLQAWVIAIAGLAMWLTPGYHAFFGWSLQTRDLDSQLLGQLLAHGYLLTHSVLALRTNIDPDLRLEGGNSVMLALTAIGLAAMLVLAWRTRHRWPWLGFGLAWYLLQLAPSNSLLPRFDLANDRHLYLALPGLALVVAGGLAQWRQRQAAAGLLVAMLLLMGVATHRRNADYRSELALWQATVRDSPGKARPWLNLGYARQQAGDRDGARRAYQCALQRDPGNTQAAINLGVLQGSARAPDGPRDACLDPGAVPR